MGTPFENKGWNKDTVLVTKGSDAIYPVEYTLRYDDGTYNPSFWVRFPNGEETITAHMPLGILEEFREGKTPFQELTDNPHTIFTVESDGVGGVARGTHVILHLDDREIDPMFRVLVDREGTFITDIPVSCLQECQDPPIAIKMMTGFIDATPEQHSEPSPLSVEYRAGKVVNGVPEINSYVHCKELGKDHILFTLGTPPKIPDEDTLKESLMSWGFKLNHCSSRGFVCQILQYWEAEDDLDNIRDISKEPGYRASLIAEELNFPHYFIRGDGEAIIFSKVLNSATDSDGMLSALGKHRLRQAGFLFLMETQDQVYCRILDVEDI